MGWSGITRVAFSPDGKLLATGLMAFDTQVRLWDVVSGKELRLLQEPREPGPPPVGRPINGVCFLTFAPDGRTLVSASRTGKFWLWDVTTGLPVHRLQAPAKDNPGFGDCFAAFSPSGSMLALPGPRGDSAIHIWETATGKERCRLPGHAGQVNAALFTPDGRYLVSGSSDATATCLGCVRPSWL